MIHWALFIFKLSNISLILPCPGPSPRIRHFSKSLWFLLEDNDIQKSNLTLHVSLVYKASKWSQRIQPGNIYKETQNVETINKQTKGIFIHKRWVRSLIGRMGDGTRQILIYNFNLFIHITTHEFKLVSSIKDWYCRALSSPVFSWTSHLSGDINLSRTSSLIS